MYPTLSRGRRRESVRARKQLHWGLADQRIVQRHRLHVGSPVPWRAAKGRSKRRPGGRGNGMNGRQAGDPGQVKSGSSGHRAGRNDRPGAGGRELKKDQGPGPDRAGLFVTDQHRENAQSSGRKVPVTGGRGSVSTSRLSAGKPVRSRTGDRGRMSAGPGPAQAVPLATGPRRETARTGDRPALSGRGRTADPQVARRSVLPAPVQVNGPHDLRTEVPVPKAGQDGSGTAVPGGRREKAAADHR